jgi:ketosteroid isomerase-like protein
MKTLVPMILSFCLIGTAMAESIGTEQELKRLETEAWNAVVKLDFKTIDRILADEFIGIYDNDDEANDPIWTKEFLISSVKSGKFVCTSIKYDDLKVRIDGNAAAVSGVTTTKETFDGQDMSGLFRFTSTWIKKPTGWKCVGDRAVRISNADAKDSDKQELIRLQQEWVRAELDRDAVALGRLLADEYTLVTPEGTFITKDQFISQNQSDDALRATSILTENLTVRIFGNVAVVRGLFKWSEGSDKNGQSLFTDTWLKRDGRWQCVATHESGAKEIQEPSPEMKKLEGLVGDWVYEGEQVDPPVDGLPYGGAGKYFGEFTWRYVLDGSFLERNLKDNNPSGTTGIINLIGYDAKAKKYTDNWFITDGSSSVATATLDGRTWTSRSTMTTSEGKKVLLRTLLEYSFDWSSAVGTTEVSPDGGKTWKFWYKDEGRKVNK